MSEGRTYLLLEDILSNYQDRKGKPIVYGKRGEKVSEIGDREEVKIVENRDGQRFPVHVGKLNKL